MYKKIFFLFAGSIFTSHYLSSMEQIIATMEKSSAEALFIIMESGDNQRLDAILSMVDNINEVFPFQLHTFLHQAVLHSNFDAITVLLKYNASLTIGDQLGQTPIHYALEKKDSKIIKFLLNRVDADKMSKAFAIGDVHNKNAWHMIDSKPEPLRNRLYNLCKSHGIMHLYSEKPLHE
ncbi:MAG: ankyrin repeat domain-containing protein [Candidatus Babeliaceae bacterium]